MNRISCLTNRSRLKRLAKPSAKFQPVRWGFLFLAGVLWNGEGPRREARAGHSCQPVSWGQWVEDALERDPGSSPILGRGPW